MKDLTQLSKVISHALRHEPEAYGLQLDSEGWVPLPDLINALNTKGWNVSPAILEEVVTNASKKRHEVSGNRIRALYGHSTSEKIRKQPATPPAVLYHGTIFDSKAGIMEHGLLPMGRQYVHLSATEAQAKIVAARRKGEILILKVNARAAHEDGIAFYREENDIWLSEPIPAKYISE